MIIEIRGVNTINKGAELMMLAIIYKLREQLKNPYFVMSTSNSISREKLLQYGIFIKKDFDKIASYKKFISYFIPSYFLRLFWNYIDQKKIDVVLDASGFAFGDVWGINKASKRLGNHITKWKAQGKKIILLPQAFGPFTKEGIADVMKNILYNADLIFARDMISFSHLERITPVNPNLFLAPDFTNLLNPRVPAYFDKGKYEVAIIINNQMLENAAPAERTLYLSLVKKIINLVEDNGYKPFFLLHETKMDIGIIELINSQLKSNLPVIKEENPLHIKGIIANCKAVFTSRFHGLASCLSQAVPCLATSWSHKYQLLLEEYNYEEGLLDVNSSDEILLNKVNAILKSPYRDGIISNLETMAEKQKIRSEDMWQRVITTING